jgi:hypothetical protein
MILSFLVLGLLGLGAVLWALLERHQRRRAAAGARRRPGVRLVLGAAALLTILFAGGCGVLFLANADDIHVTWQAVAVLSGPPIALGLLVWWLAMRGGSAAPRP